MSVVESAALLDRDVETANTFVLSNLPPELQADYAKNKFMRAVRKRIDSGLVLVKLTEYFHKWDLDW